MGTKNKWKDRKGQLLEAALAVIAKEGVMAANSHTVTKKLGVSQPGFFYYFPTQADFFRDLLNYTVERNHQTVTELRKKRDSKKSLDKLQTYIEGNLLWAEKYPSQVSVLVTALGGSSHDPLMRDIISTALTGGEETVYSILTSGFTEGEFKPKVPVRTIASLIHKQVLAGVLFINYVGKHEKVSGKLTEDIFLMAKQLLEV